MIPSTRRGGVHWTALILGGVLVLAACTSSPPPPPPSSSGAQTSVPSSSGPGSSAPSSPAAASSSASTVPSSAPGTKAGGAPVPTGEPIAAVNDYLLPAGLGVLTPPEGDPDFALDDLTSDVYFAGVPVAEDTGEPTASTSEAIYHFDLTTSRATKIAGTTLGPGAQVYGVIATNGWVFWTEALFPPEGQDGPVTRRCQASKADGTDLTTLEEVRSTPIADGNWVDDFRVGCAFSAGGGSALWFGRRVNDDTLTVRHTASGRQIPISAPTPIPGRAAINGDVIVMAADPPALPTKLVHVQSGAITDLAATSAFSALSNQVIAWTASTDSSSELHSCMLNTADPTSTCSKPTTLGTWPAPFDPASGLVGVAGGYVVVNPPQDNAQTTLISARDPQQRTAIPGYISEVAGQRLAGLWNVRRAGDSTSAPPTRVYLRVITLA